MYQVQLQAKHDNGGEYNNGNFELLYEELALTVRANIEEGNVSKPNKSETESCIGLVAVGSSSESFPFWLEVDESDNSATLFASDDLLDEMNEELPVIEFTDYVSQVLFTLVVDFFPGEPTGAFLTDFHYIYDDTEETSASNSVNGSPPPYYLGPDVSNNDFTLSLGTPTCGDEYVVFPVKLTSSVSNDIEHLDFSVQVATDKPLAGQPQIQNVLGGTSPIYGDPVALPDDGGFAYLISYENETLYGSNLTLFEIKVPSPSFLTGGYQIDALLKEGRLIVEGDGDCDKPAVGDDEEDCTKNPVPLCDPADFTLIVQSESNPANDCILKVYISLDWDENELDEELTFNELYFRVDFNLPPDVEIKDIYPAAMSNPVDNECTDWILPTSPGGNTVEICVDSENGIALTDDSFVIVEFNAPAGCIADAYVKEASLRLEGQNDPCVPDTSKFTFPYCTPLVKGNIATEEGCYVDNVTLEVLPDPLPNPPDALCEHSFITECATYSVCVCPQYEDYSVTPSKDDNPLNGVSTFDLVLISRHILGLELLDSPYKIIAADANKNEQVATSDIVEIRKLILGIETEFPNNTSWRFVDKKFEFADPTEPLEDNFPESITGALPLNEADFVAVKVGDVNHTAIVCDDCSAPRSSDLAAYRLDVPALSAERGEVITVPLTAGDGAPLVAWQLALRFDSQALELVGPSAGDLEGLSQGSFGLTRSGEGLVRALWLAQAHDEEDHLREGQRLFFLTFRAKRRLDDLSTLLRLDEAALPCRGWTADGGELALQLAPVPDGAARGQAADGNTLAVRCRPNPTSDAVQLDFDLPEASRVRLSVYDAFGARVLFREIQAPAGEQTLELTEAALWAAGIYRYDLRVGKKARAKGHIVKQ
jgi:hypothetical protein